MGWLDWLTSGWSNRPPSREKFTQLFLSELRKAGETRPLEVDPQEFRILVGDDRQGMMWLGNFYAEYCALPKEKQAEYLARMARISQTLDRETVEDGDLARERLRPKVWLNASLAFASLRARIDNPASEGLSTPQYEIGTHLIASIVYDLPESMRSVSESDLEMWGLTYYEALEIARENLERQPFSFAQIGDGLYASATGDCYDASRLLLPGFLDKLQVRGDLVALAANRDTLLLTGTEDPDGLQGMLAIAAQSQQQPRPMSFIPVRRVGEDWVDWLPPANHKLHREFKEQAVRFLHGLYHEQQELLNQWHEKRQEDLFVASYSAIQDKASQQISSYTVWGEGVAALLPQADHICFVRRGATVDDAQPLGMARWDEVAAAVGDLLQLTDDYPLRFRVDEFPTPAMLDKIELQPL